MIDIYIISCFSIFVFVLIWQILFRKKRVKNGINTHGNSDKKGDENGVTRYSVKGERYFIKQITGYIVDAQKNRSKEIIDKTTTTSYYNEYGKYLYQKTNYDYKVKDKQAWTDLSIQLLNGEKANIRVNQAQNVPFAAKRPITLFLISTEENGVYQHYKVSFHDDDETWILNKEVGHDLFPVRHLINTLMMIFILIGSFGLAIFAKGFLLGFIIGLAVYFPLAILTNFLFFFQIHSVIDGQLAWKCDEIAAEEKTAMLRYQN